MAASCAWRRQPSRPGLGTDRVPDVPVTSERWRQPMRRAFSSKARYESARYRPRCCAEPPVAARSIPWARARGPGHLLAGALPWISAAATPPNAIWPRWRTRGAARRCRGSTVARRGLRAEAAGRPGQMADACDEGRRSRRAPLAWAPRNSGPRPPCTARTGALAQRACGRRPAGRGSADRSERWAGHRLGGSPVRPVGREELTPAWPAARGDQGPGPGPEPRHAGASRKRTTALKPRCAPARCEPRVTGGGTRAPFSPADLLDDSQAQLIEIVDVDGRLTF